MIKLYFLLMVFILIGCNGNGEKETLPSKPVSIQLNWLHDPTFAGEYMLSKNGNYFLKEGGVTIHPLSVLKQGNADMAVVGVDIFLKALDNDIEKDGKSELIAVFADFQRNPVGWILHPSVGEKFGIPSNDSVTAKEKNKWLFKQFENGTLSPGDKRGTETTSIWIQWKKIHGLSDKIKVMPVGFDPLIVLNEPKIAYPVYLNEEPFKLSSKLPRPVLEFDPAIDGVNLYGNIIVTTRNFLEKNKVLVRRFQEELANAWEIVKEKPDSAITLVKEVYPNVKKDIIYKQVKRTVEFVYYGNVKPGRFDVEQGGKMSYTIKALKNSEMISENLSLSKVKEHMLLPAK